MRMAFYTVLVFGLVGLPVVLYAQDKLPESTDGIQESDSVTVEKQAISDDVVFATYLHGTLRCATCRKLEAYSEEALKTAFEEELNDSSLIWRVINYDEKENEHYLKDYSLYTKALILSRVKDGSELEWKNLSKIWELVGNKDEFLKYVQDETRDFINKESD